MHTNTLSNIAQLTIYMATIDYMVASYGVYSASAMARSALAVDFTRGVSALYATPRTCDIFSTFLLSSY